MAATLARPCEWTVEELHASLATIEADTGDNIDYRCFEIVDGSLIVSPPAAPRPELLTSRLIVMISRFAPAGYEIAPTIGVDMERSYLVPDLLVVPSTRFHSGATRLPPSDPLVVIEIVSPGSTTMDRVTKPAVYAAAGLAHYWRVETRPAITITAYDLDGDAYREVGTWGPGATMTLEHPFPVTVAMDELGR